jgi:two-component system, cell cycle sensor histidine kinase and response regulator CckA
MSVKPRILVVEDERIVAAGLRKRLLQLGYEVPAMAHSGEDAVRTVREILPELVLMDIQLEGEMDGVQAAAEMRRLGVPVVYLTAYSNSQILDRAKATEPYGYILKPFEERELHVVIETALYKHRMERQLKERERWLSAVLRSIGDGVVATDGAGRITLLNPTGERLTGWASEDADGKMLDAVFTLVQHGARQPVEAPLHRAIRERRSVPMANHTVLIGRDGSECPIDDCATPVVDEQGVVLGGVMVFRDVSERFRAEQELRLRDRAIQGLSQGIVIADASHPDMPIIYASPGFLKSTGYESHEVLGRNGRFLQGPETDQETVGRMRQAILAEQPVSVEILNYKKGDKPFWNDVSIYPVRDDDGRLTHFICVQADVTERRRLEMQFRQAQKMEAVGRLAGGVAHDFNNLLTVINGFSQLLLEILPGNHNTVEMLQEILKAGERAAGLTQQLLTYSRRQMVQPKVLDLNVAVENGKKWLERVIGEDVELTSVPAADLRRVKADPGQVDQVLMNLCVNARDAMPTGGKISIKTENVELDACWSAGLFDVRPGRYVLLAVTDTGCGMDAETQAHIFEPFFTTKELGKGTGLGLATVYGIVKQAGGYVKVHSQQGRGASFEVYLPAVNDAPEEGAPSNADSPRGAETVMVVEDEEAVRALTRLLLENKGYKVLVAASGSEALELARQERIDLLVTDVVMPKMSGRQVAEALRLLNPELKVLFISGYTDDAVVRHGVSEAETSFLQKPFTLYDIAQKIRQVLDNEAK